MTTQTLRGMAKNGPMHWRGDRTGGLLDDGDPLDAAQALGRFDGAFDSLLGLGRPMDADAMRRLADFVLAIVPPPNPYRALDGSLSPEEQAGRDLFVGRPTDQAGFNCVGCHTLSPRDGAFGADGQSAMQGGPQLMKIPHLRNLYTKVGMFGVPPVPQLGGGDATPTGPQIRGFGFTHDGSVDTIARFLGSTSFTLSDVERRQLEAFLLAFDSDLAPIVGQQVTLPSGSAARWDLLRARADAGECDLVARGVANGEARGWLGVARGLFVADRRADAPIDDAALRALATADGQELTLTCVPPGSGPRMAIDRDEDGFLDRDELDAGTDPADPASRPDGDPLPLARIPIRTSALALRGAAAVQTMTFVAKTKKDAAAHRIVPPPPAGAFDPTVHGAVLHVYNAGFTKDAAIVELPASGWRRAGSAKRPKGYRFRGAGQRVLLGPDVLKVRMRGLAAYSLDEPAQGRVAVRLASGLLTGGGWCASAPAKPRGRHASTAKSDRPGRFLAKPQSPPPNVCPPEP
jgi:mono/diheme cytochrome c family protein